MITVRKLATLSRTARVRKAARMLQAWEGDHRLPDRVYVLDLLLLLEAGAEQPEVQAAIAHLRLELEAVSPNPIPHSVWRAVNALRHQLLQSVGRDQADWDLLPRNESGVGMQPLRGVVLYLEDLRSPFNVGSIFRTAAAFGVDCVLVSPGCAAPDHPRAARSAMGATSMVEWRRAGLGSLPLPLIALELGGEPVDAFAFPTRGTLAVGSEELGLSPELLGAADARVSVSLYGPKASLNVGVALGIGLHAWACLLRR